VPGRALKIAAAERAKEVRDGVRSEHITIENKYLASELRERGSGGG
jgi:hypothetical protein